MDSSVQLTKSKTSSTSAAGHDGSVDASEEEDEDSSSSNLGVEDTLAAFREKWQNELKISTKQKKCETLSKAISPLTDTDEDDEKTAKVLFLKGAEMERAGKLYEAIQFYRRAVQLVPDIEFRLDYANKNKVMNPKNSPTALHEDDNKRNCNIHDSDDDNPDEDANGKDLLIRIQKRLINNQTFCVPAYEQRATHISVLPVEILLYIFRWVVSSDLDMRSLEMCSLVCRGFYVCARDSEIWRLACVRAWGLNCGNLPNTYTSWRHMFLERARLHFNGCYISKTTYIRHGENSFQDQFYRPWHLVAYYRYLRFFPEGKVLMLTTAEEPAHSVALLKGRNTKNPSILVGHYRLKDDRVTLVVHRQDNHRSNQNFKRNRRRDNLHEPAEQSFHMELQIQSHNKRKHVQLVWTRYAVLSRTMKGDETNCSFDLVTNRFPPLWFSRVKSYTSESDCPLT